MEGYQWGGGDGRIGREDTGNKHNWQVENRQGRLRMVQEIEKPKNLYVQPMDMNWGENAEGQDGTGWRGNKEKKQLGQL